MDQLNTPTTKTQTNSQAHKPENPLIVLLCNLILPILILNQGAKHLGPMGSKFALILALAAPLGYGIYSYRRLHKPNFISLVGILNVLITGSFALLHLEGRWFCLKEAAFPILIGVAIAILNRVGEPFLYSLFWNENIFRVKKIESVLAERLNVDASTPLPRMALDGMFKRASDYFSFSFFVSGTGNFFLARKIFLPIDPTLDMQAHAQALNAQIASMTWRAYAIIALPMMVFMGLVLWFLLFRLQEMTGLTTEELLATDTKNEPKPEVAT
jgi:hypothetical protein